MNELQTIYKTLFKAFGPQHWWPGDTPFEIAVGAILTQNTNWGNVEKAIKNLKAARALNAKRMHEMPLNKLAVLIRPAGYFNIKTKRLKAFIRFLMDNYEGSIKKMSKEDFHELREKLLSVNGIGPETADSILLYAVEKPVFVIDAYTKRVLSRHKLVAYGESYDACQRLFHNSLKKDTALYNEYHALFVQAGKMYCRPKPLCEHCPLNPIDVHKTPSREFSGMVNGNRKAPRVV